MSGRLFVAMQHVLPQHALSRLVLSITRVRTPWFKNLTTRAFLTLFPRVDMSEAQEADPYAYGSFNEFFTRTLRADVRPTAAATDAIVCPVDGTVSQLGVLDEDRLLQAKGRFYTLPDLLAKRAWASRFVGGSFMTIYLAPFDYHRIHMPARGTLRDTVYVPGRLFSVNTVTAARVPRLFARNERVLTLFDSPHGQFAVILVGALNVGSIATVWAGDIAPAPHRKITHYAVTDLTLERAQEMGRFNMGSTVILLFERGRVEWNPTLDAGTPVKLGQSLGRLA